MEHKEESSATHVEPKLGHRPYFPDLMDPTFLSEAIFLNKQGTKDVIHAKVEKTFSMLFLFFQHFVTPNV